MTVESYNDAAYSPTLSSQKYPLVFTPLATSPPFRLQF
jgi:hypothetical protein